MVELTGISRRRSLRKYKTSNAEIDRSAAMVPASGVMRLKKLMVFQVGWAQPTSFCGTVGRAHPTPEVRNAATRLWTVADLTTQVWAGTMQRIDSLALGQLALRPG